MKSQSTAQVTIPAPPEKSAIPGRQPPAPNSSDKQSAVSETKADRHIAIRRPVGTRKNRARALEGITAQGMFITGADGFAIALPHGNGIVCECSAGVAPAIGVWVEGEGYSGECLHSAQPIYCRDLVIDQAAKKTDRTAIRSALLVPIVYGGEAVGLMAAFSASPTAFEAKHQIWMSKVADAISAAGFVGSRAGEGARTSFQVCPRQSHPNTLNEAWPALGFKIQEWFIAQQHQCRRWANVSMLGGAAAVAVLLSPLYITTPYLLWLLTAGAAVVAIAAGHNTRRLAHRAQCELPPRHLVGLALGYAAAVAFALMLALLHSGG